MSLGSANSCPPCFIVDAFADPNSSGTGNPAAVVILPAGEKLTEQRKKWMQMVANEFNLSETAFVWPEMPVVAVSGGEVHYNIRYFTPTVEIALCGHATLASAAVLYQAVESVARLSIVFHAQNDLLRADWSGSGKGKHRSTSITMTFPTMPVDEITPDDTDHVDIEDMLSSSLSIGSRDIVYVGYSSDLGDLLVQVKPEAFGSIGYGKLDLSAMLEYEGYSRGVILCCKKESVSSVTSDNEQTTDFLSRFFGPKAGIEEDPVTGSAHCALAPYFCRKLGKKKVVGTQASQRGGIVVCELMEDSSSVKLTGEAVTTVSGTLMI